MLFTKFGRRSSAPVVFLRANVLSLSMRWEDCCSTSQSGTWPRQDANRHACKGGFGVTEEIDTADLRFAFCAHFTFVWLVSCYTNARKCGAGDSSEIHLDPIQ